MRRLVGLASAAGALALMVAVTTGEPTEPLAVAGALVGIGLIALSLATALSASFARGRRRAARLLAVRRGLLVGAAVATLALLRALDALTAVTAVFVVAAAAALEGALSARR